VCSINNKNIANIQIFYGFVEMNTLNNDRYDNDSDAAPMMIIIVINSSSSNNSISVINVIILTYCRTQKPTETILHSLMKLKKPRKSIKSEKYSKHGRPHAWARGGTPPPLVEML